MMKEEFEAIAGYEVSYDDYHDIIEPMYMAAKLDKYAFCDTLNKKRFALPTKKQIQNEMKRIAKHLSATCGQYTDYDSKHKLERIAYDYAKRFYGFDRNNLKHFCYFEDEYEFPAIQRGCTYPFRLIIGRVEKDGLAYYNERLTLVP